MGLEPMVMDLAFLQALEAGIPACSGVALGLDRLFALLLKKNSIAEVMSFSFPNL
jgi:lysyl-tRNA synthetase class 2